MVILNYIVFGGINGFDTTAQDEDDYPYNIVEINGRYLFFYPPYRSGIRRSRSVMKEAVKIGNKVGISEQHSRYCWYIAQSKSTGECIIVRAANQDVEPYEVPELRKLLSNQPAVGDIDIVASHNYFYSSDNGTNGKRPVPPVGYKAIFTVYNRNDSCLYFGKPTDSLGYFAWVNGKDTLHLHTQRTFLEDKYIDDPYYNYDSQKVYRFNISSDDAYTFFSRLPINDFYESLYRLMQDSVFYFPNIQDYKEKVLNNCYYPRQRIKVMFPIECGYDYVIKNGKFNDEYDKNE